jgi:hypothetical protein
MGEKLSKSNQGVPFKKCGRKSSSYVGVYWSKRQNKWVAEIRHMRKRYWLGLHDTEADAARAYDQKALELYGINAKLNFPVST